ncbi:MAG: hypothetical protein WC702_02585 [Patescibacteria group bacterium]|jgi:hypothetical protein
MLATPFAPSAVSANGFKIVVRIPDPEQATLAASEGFGKPIDPALEKDVTEHLAACHFGLSFFSSEDEFAGFALYRRLGNILCGGGMVLRTAFQAHGLGQIAIQTARVVSQTEYLAFRTQSLRMWTAGKKAVSIWRPNPSGTDDPALAEAIERAAIFLKVNQTVTSGFYGGPLYGKKPLYTKDAARQAWWDSICSFERGDAILCVGRF